MPFVNLFTYFLMRVIQSQYLVHFYIPGVYSFQKILVATEMLPPPPPRLFTSSYLTHFYCVRLTLENQVTNDGPFAQISLAAIATLRKPRSPWQASFLKTHLHGSLRDVALFRNMLTLMIKRRWAFLCSSSENGWLRMLQYTPQRVKTPLKGKFTSSEFFLGYFKYAVSS